MKIFDDIRRDDAGPALHSEPKFTYLNRSARPAFHAIRNILEEWFSRYPEAHRKDLRARFRDVKDRHHNSAFFELFLHQLLLRLGCQVGIHPPLEGTAKTPDFLVESETGVPFYLEATASTGEKQSEASTRAISRKLHDMLDRLDSPNFIIGWKLKGSTQHPPAARKIKAFLKQRLALLDPEQIASDFKSRGYDALPHWRYSHEGWLIEFFPSGGAYIPACRDVCGQKAHRDVTLQCGSLCA